MALSPDHIGADGPPLEAQGRLRFYRGIDSSAPWLGSRASLRPRDAAHWPGASLADAFARALCERSAVPVKELFEASETFALARRTLSGGTVADICCGHGLGGVFFALMERRVERVLLVDRVRPASADAVLAAAADVAPWVAGKIEWRIGRLERTELPAGADVLAIHACGMRTDRALASALETGGSFAALPCCRPHGPHPAPESLKNALGADVAIDVHRTYRLENAGWTAAWRTIAPTITPMNRVLLGRAPVSAP